MCAAICSAQDVTPETYIRAEVDFALADFQKNAGGKVNEFFYITKPTPLNEQAGALFLFPEKDAVYINCTGPTDPSKCYQATYEVPSNDAFCSITVYGEDGFMKSDNNIVVEESNFTIAETGRKKMGTGTIIPAD